MIMTPGSRDLLGVMLTGLSPEEQSRTFELMQEGNRVHQSPAEPITDEPKVLHASRTGPVH